MKTKTHPIDWTGCPDWIREPLQRGETPVAFYKPKKWEVRLVAWDSISRKAAELDGDGLWCDVADLCPITEPDPRELIGRWVYYWDGAPYLREERTGILRDITLGLGSEGDWCYQSPAGLSWFYIQAADFSTGEPRPVGPIFGPGGKVVQE